MTYSVKRRLYEALPVAIKRGVGLVPFGWWAGEAYRLVYGRRDWFDKASQEDLRQYQERQLDSALKFAVEHVPAFQSFRTVVSRYKPTDALKEFPLLDKDTIQKNQVSYLPRIINKIPHYVTTTGGTSGNQLKIYLEDCSQSVELGFMHRQWLRVGYTPKHRKATFRGVSFPDVKPGVYWQHNPLYNELQFSPFHMNEINLGSYVDQLIQYSPSYLHGYPSALDIMAEYILRHNLTGKLPKINAALLGSEGVSTSQRRRIEQAFNTRAYSWYGHSERAVLAGECEVNSTYHHIPDYGFLEIVDGRGVACDQDGDRGEIVGTGFFNRCMPLIRYRTGDYAIRVNSRCDCGRIWHRFTNVEAHRKQEAILGKRGTKISIAALNMHGAIFERVVRSQYSQDVPGICVLKVMANPEFTERDRMAIQAAYQSKVGDELQFNVVVVDDIPLTARGKLKVIESRLNTMDAQ